MAPRRAKRKRNDEASASGTTEAANSPQMEDSAETIPSGHPFVDYEVDWVYTRYNLVGRPNKTMFTGYESMAGDVRLVLESLPLKYYEEVKNSSMGAFSHLADLSTRCGKMIHYVVFREVEPSPNIDKTALWFKIGDKVLRFSRVEYTLVSGLKFGRAEFNPYKRHRLPSSSIYERLFGANPLTTTAMVRNAFVNKHFEVDGVEVTATPEDYVQLSKFLLALTFALGLDQTKKKIPLWLWVLLENKEQWEAFPWGSYSYQLLVDSIRSVVRRERKTNSGKVSYHIKGNTIAFLAWIFEAIPVFGRVVGSKKNKRERPRFLRYKYMKERGYPSEEEIVRELVPLLKPHKKELKKKYWKSLKDEPEGMPFALQYDANECKKKKLRDDGDEGEQDDPSGNTEVPVSAHVTASANCAPPHMDDVMLRQMGDIVAEVVAKKLKDLVDEMLQQYHKKIAKDVVEYVVNRLRERAPDDDYHPMDLRSTPISTQLNIQQPTNAVASVEVAVASTLPAATMGSEMELVHMASTEATKENEVGATEVEIATTLEVAAAAETLTTLADTSPKASFIDPPASGVEQVVPPISIITLQDVTICENSQIIPKSIQTRFPSAACKSPFLGDYIQPNVDAFDIYICDDGVSAAAGRPPPPRRRTMFGAGDQRRAPTDSNQLPINSREMVVFDASTPSAGGVHESVVNNSKRLEDDLQQVGEKIKHHEDNVNYLKTLRNTLDDSIVDLQVALGKHYTSLSKEENGNGAHVDSEEETIRRIMKYEKSVAALLCKMKSEAEFLDHQLTKDVVGVVATVGKVDDVNLSRILSEYLGLETMLSVVCKSFEGVKTLETFTRDGLTNNSSDIHEVAASMERRQDGRCHVICLEHMRPYAGELIADDPQRRLNLPKPRLINGQTPPGFLGFAVNMVTIDNSNLYCISNAGHSLRETLFYNLFLNLQVYKSREEMLKARSCITTGAISLDGGLIKSPGIFSLGHHGREIDVKFPCDSKKSVLPVSYFELENQLKETKWKKDRTMEDMQREQELLDQAKFKYETKKKEFVRFLAESSYIPQVGPVSTPR